MTGPRSKRRWRAPPQRHSFPPLAAPEAPPEHALAVPMLRQPDDTTCGPTCLHAVYQYHGDPVPLRTVIDEVPSLEGGGTLAVLLGCHALRRGYDATIYTYNLQVFDPTWFRDGTPPLARKLVALAENRSDQKLRNAARAYVDFLGLGGKILFQDLTADLLRRYLKRGIPVLTGLSSTFLYRSARELPGSNESDDVRGLPAGHFVVLSGYRETNREVRVADPWYPNPVSREGQYWVGIPRLVNSILLGILTYDANLLIIERKKPPGRPETRRPKDPRRAYSGRRQ